MKHKAFDCVEMKNRIQQELREEEARVGGEIMRRRQEDWLRTGQDELSRLWRKLRTCRKEESAVTAVREEESP